MYILSRVLMSKYVKKNSDEYFLFLEFSFVTSYEGHII